MNDEETMIMYLFVTDAEQPEFQPCAAVKTLKTMKLSEIKSYDALVLLSADKPEDITLQHRFMQLERNPEADYALLCRDEDRSCCLLLIKTSVITDELKEKIVRHCEDRDLYGLAEGLKADGLYGEAVFFEEDYFEELIKKKDMEKKELLTAAEKYLKKYCSKYENIYVYGAGVYGERCVEALNKAGVRVKAVIETTKTKDLLGETKICSFDEAGIGDNDAVILALKKDFCFQVLPLLVEKGIVNYCIYPFWM